MSGTSKEHLRDMRAISGDVLWGVSACAQFAGLMLLHKALSAPWRFYPDSVKSRTVEWRWAIGNRVTSISDDLEARLNRIEVDQKERAR